MRHKHKRMGIEKRIYKTNINQMLRYLTLIFYGVFGIGCIYAFLLIFCFSTFKIPSDSMEPQLQTGDQVLVNKWIAGPRLFNIFASMKGKRVDIYRVPGVGQIKRNDILVFNYPHPIHGSGSKCSSCNIISNAASGYRETPSGSNRDSTETTIQKSLWGMWKVKRTYPDKKRIGCRTVSTVVSLLILHSIGMFMISVLCISPEKGIELP